MTRALSFRTVTRDEWRLLAVSVPLVIGVRIALWLFPSGAIVRRVRAIASRPPSDATATASPTEIAWAVDAVARRIPGASCLTQAVSAHLLLRRHGHQPELCVGVARDENGAFRAHAWVEIAGGIVIGGSGSRRFNRLADFGVPALARSAEGDR